MVMGVWGLTTSEQRVWLSSASGRGEFEAFQARVKREYFKKVNVKDG